MAITYLGGKIHKRAGATTTVSVSLTDIPAVGGGTVTLADGDLVVVGYAIGAITDINVEVTTVYTEEADIYSNGTQYDTNLGVFTKFMGSTPDTTVTLGAMASANNSGVTAIRAYRGVDLTTPLDVAIVTATGTGTGKPDPPAATPVTSGALAFVIGAQAAATMANLASSDLSDFATDWQTDSQDVGIGVGHISWSGSGAIDPAVFTGGSSNSSNSWAAATLVLRPIGGPATHSTTGALTGQNGSVAGSAAHVAIHGTSGVLAGQIGSVSGSAARKRAMASSGALTGQIGAVSGAAARADPPVSHATSGSLVGQLGGISGTASRFRAHASPGALAGQGATVSGAAQRFRAVATSGVITGPGSAVAGMSTRIRVMLSSGALVGLAGGVSGATVRFRAMATTGTLSGQGSTVAGSAARAAGSGSHSASGTLVGPSSTVSGTARRFRTLATSGVLAGAGAQVAGVAARSQIHSATGALTGQGAALFGTAQRAGILVNLGARNFSEIYYGSRPQSEFYLGTRTFSDG